ncbi:MAG: Rieske 2Fe-2S domain-containing protein [Burkholderiaceae bacterium]
MTGWLRICRSDELEEGAQGVRFAIGPGGESAFAIRSKGGPRAFLNRCSHVPIELDWPEAVFFDDDARFIQCATHGAMYDPGTGACVGGPCAGRGLVALQCNESDGTVWARQQESLE